jgi:hypothetical protein
MDRMAEGELPAAGDGVVTFDRPLLLPQRAALQLAKGQQRDYAQPRPSTTRPLRSPRYSLPAWVLAVTTRGRKPVINLLTQGSQAPGHSTGNGC